MRPLVARLMIVLVLCATPALSAERYAVIITGASGGEEYGRKFDAVRTSLVETLRGFGYPDNQVIVLADGKGPGLRPATREEVRTVANDLARRVTKDDVVLFLLVGHGTTFTGPDAKFNLVGPDLAVAEWAALLQRIRARLVFVNATSSSYPFLRSLAAEGRVVITATDSGAQQFDTLFPVHFVAAFKEDAADLDKNGRVSIWEAFSHASARVKAWFGEQGRLTTERSLLDDTGMGVGRDAEGAGKDGALAQVTYLEPDRAPDTAGAPVSGAVLERRAALNSQLELLRARRDTMPPEEYERQLEALLLELARLDRQLRQP